MFPAHLQASNESDEQFYARKPNSGIQSCIISSMVVMFQSSPSLLFLVIQVAPQVAEFEILSGN
jgi:hypothetical protein